MRGGLYNPRPVDDVPVNGQVQHGVTSNWAFDHAADLDAHTHNMLEQIRVGEYFHSLPILETGAALAMTVDRVQAIPFIVPRRLTIDRLAVQVTILAAGSIIRLGIYEADGGNLYPGTLVLDAGTVSGAAVAIVAAVVAQQLEKGLYYLVAVSNGIPTVRIVRQSWSPLGNNAANFIPFQQYWQLNAFGSGALPDPFTAGAGVQNNWGLAILPRLLSLD